MVDIALIKIWGERVGAVRWDENDQLAYFEYEPEFLRTGWELSPLKLPLAEGKRIFSFPELRKGRGVAEDTFNGLPSMLADALPDKYGNRLIDAWLVQHGRPEGSMNPVEKLCFIGARGMGALEFEPPQFKSGVRTFSVEIASLVELANSLLHEREGFTADLSRDQEQAMKEILKIGTSAGGARPKAVIAFNPKTNEVRSGQGNVPKGFEHWLIKLDGVSGDQFGESSGWGRIEYAYYLMARDSGIDISESRLLEENGRAHFMTRRFDREGNTRHHVQTLCGLQGYDYNDMNSYSYEQVFQTMRLLRLSYPEAEQMFRRMVFNVLATNYDDHTKNFSFILKKGGRWQLAPAYDLCFSYNPTNQWVSQQTLSVNGKRRDIRREDLMKIAKDNSVKKGEQIINEMVSVIRSWPAHAEKAGVSQAHREHINAHLNAKREWWD